MDEHDADGFALLIVGGRDEEGEIEADGEQRDPDCREPRQHAVGEAHEKAGIGEGGEAEHLCIFARAGAVCKPDSEWEIL